MATLSMSEFDQSDNPDSIIPPESPGGIELPLGTVAAIRSGTIITKPDGSKVNIDADGNEQPIESEEPEISSESSQEGRAYSFHNIAQFNTCDNKKGKAKWDCFKKHWNDIKDNKAQNQKCLFLIYILGLANYYRTFPDATDAFIDESVTKIITYGVDFNITINGILNDEELKRLIDDLESKDQQIAEMAGNFGTAQYNSLFKALLTLQLRMIIRHLKRSGIPQCNQLAESLGGIKLSNVIAEKLNILSNMHDKAFLEDSKEMEEIKAQEQIQSDNRMGNRPQHKPKRPSILERETHALRRKTHAKSSRMQSPGTRPFPKIPQHKQSQYSTRRWDKLGRLDTLVKKTPAERENLSPREQKQYDKYQNTDIQRKIRERSVARSIARAEARKTHDDNPANTTKWKFLDEHQKHNKFIEHLMSQGSHKSKHLSDAEREKYRQNKLRKEIERKQHLRSRRDRLIGTRPSTSEGLNKWREQKQIKQWKTEKHNLLGGGHADPNYKKYLKYKAKYAKLKKSKK